MKASVRRAVRSVVRSAVFCYLLAALAVPTACAAAFPEPLAARACWGSEPAEPLERAIGRFDTGQHEVRVVARWRCQPSNWAIILLPGAVWDPRPIPVITDVTGTRVVRAVAGNAALDFSRDNMAPAAAELDGGLCFGVPTDHDLVIDGILDVVDANEWTADLPMNALIVRSFCGV